MKPRFTDNTLCDERLILADSGKVITEEKVQLKTQGLF